MKNPILQMKLQDEVLAFIDRRRSLMLASLDANGQPCASCAPFAACSACFYILISELALHAVNLQVNPRASVLLIEDEDPADEFFARLRVTYAVEASHIERSSNEWIRGVALLGLRLGDRIRNLSARQDFHLFRLQPRGGRYVKDLGRAYAIRGNRLAGEALDHLCEGRQPS